MSHLQTVHIGSSIAGGVCKKSEHTLNCILDDFKQFCSEYIKELGVNGRFEWQKSIKVSELICGYDNDKCFMSPDGGLFFIVLDDKKYCFLIVEDKYQGTNDLRLSKGLQKQGLGNAIERVFKNLNASWHLFKNLTISPYLVFAAGCDFHSSESIIHRIGALSNFGRKPIVWEMTNDGTFNVSDMLQNINIKKDVNREFATFCVKTHKYDAFPYESSIWKGCERMEIMKYITKESLKEIILYHNRHETVCASTHDNIHR